MNINKLLRWLNAVPIFATLIFAICLKTLVPEQYKSYIDGLLLIVVAIFSAGPFVINYLVLRTILLPKQRLSYIALLLLFLLAIINLFCLFIMYRDQFESSRGFALLVCLQIYLFAFLPLWVIFLVIPKITKKRILS